MQPHEMCYIENIIRQARQGRDKALDYKDGYAVDHFENILSYAECFLPKDSPLRERK